MEIIWEDPPPPKVGRWRSREADKQAMKDNPGKWMLYNADAGAGTARHLKKEGFEISARSIPGTKRYRVYTRWPEEK